MILVGIDIGKNQHTFSIIDKGTGEILSNPSVFNNNQEGFLSLIKKLSDYAKSELLIGMEDTGHYHFALLKYLLDSHYTVALINPATTDLTRKLQGGITKNDSLDSLTICDVISSNHRKKPYRITKVNRFDLYEQKQLTRHHHNLKEELNIYKNRLQKCIDIVFPEFNSLFQSKYGIVYMNVLNSAREYAYFITPYLLISDEMKKAFTLAARRGVDVRIITPGIPDKKFVYQATRSYYNRLVKKGVRIFEYTPGFCHAKQCVSDDKAAVVGTINLDYRSLYHHFENAAAFYHKDAVAGVKADFDHLFEECHEVTEQYRSHRSTALRIGQCILRLFAPLL